MTGSHPPAKRPSRPEARLLATTTTRIKRSSCCQVWAGRRARTGSWSTRALAIDVREQNRIHTDLVREAFTDLAELPFYFYVTPLLVREGWSGPEGGGGATIDWNFSVWDKKS